MSSAGLRLLLSIYRQITGAGGKIALAAVVDEIKDTMSVTGFLKFFVVHDTVAEAVASLAALIADAGEERMYMLDRIDVHPTHTIAGFQLRVGKAFPFGATIVPGGVNFSVFSRFATDCTLVLFEKGERGAVRGDPVPGRVPHRQCLDDDRLRSRHRTARIRLPHGRPLRPAGGQRFDKSKVLLDPYARVIGGRDIWGVQPDWSDAYHHRGRLAFDDFDWEHDRPLETPIEDLVIYEAHVRSFTGAPVRRACGIPAPSPPSARRSPTSRSWASIASNCCRSTSSTSSRTAARAR